MPLSFEAIKIPHFDHAPPHGLTGNVCDLVLVSFQAACKTSKTQLEAQEKGVTTQESAIKAAEDAVTNAESSASAKVVASAAFVVAATIAAAVF